MYKNRIFEKVETMKLLGDTLHINFAKGKSIILSTEKDMGDGDVYLDFSIIELYKDKILSNWRIDEVEIKIVKGEGILLCIGESKIFIPGYHNSVYYTSDMTLIVTYFDGEVTKINKFDMKEGVFNFS